MSVDPTPAMPLIGAVPTVLASTSAYRDTDRKRGRYDNARTVEKRRAANKAARRARRAGR